MSLFCPIESFGHESSTVNTHCKIYMKNWNKFNRISNKNVTNFIKQILMKKQMFSN